MSSSSDDSRPLACVEPVRVSAACCPECKKPVDPRYRPFCSKRCADVDLHRWMSESYRVPVLDAPEQAGDTGVSPDDKKENEL